MRLLMQNKAFSRNRVLVARAVFPEVLARLRGHFDVESNQDDVEWSQDELAVRLQGRAGLFATSAVKIDAALIAHCPSLRAVANMAVGYNNVDLAAARDAGIVVTNTPGVLDNATADFAWALLLAAARRVGESGRWLRDGKWDHWRYDGFLGADVYGSTLGVIGMGRIGAAIARRARGFDMTVLYHNRRPTDPATAPGAQYVAFDELLARADHVVLALPYTPQAHHLIGGRELALMKPTATLINIARGGVVDDAALADALRSGRLGAAGLDVFENEPRVLPALLDLPNAVLTPHIASATLSARMAMADCAADNLIAALTGGVPRNPVPLPAKT
jgi:gluconate 2-dehydrogenase